MEKDYGCEKFELRYAGLAQQEIYNRNQTTSRLLALPLEIRWRIFELILLDKHIHIRDRNSPDKPRVLLLPPWEPPPDYTRHNDSSSPFRRQLKIGRAGRQPIQDRTATWIKLTPIWRTCRQIYHETTRLIYSDMNSLSFEIPSFHLISRLLDGQLGNITKHWVHDLWQVEEILWTFSLQRDLGDGALEQKVKEVRIPSLRDSLRKTAISSRGALDMRRRFDADAEEAKVEQIKRKLASIPAVVIQV